MVDDRNNSEGQFRSTVCEPKVEPNGNVDDDGLVIGSVTGGVAAIGSTDESIIGGVVVIGSAHESTIGGVAAAGSADESMISETAVEPEFEHHNGDWQSQVHDAGSVDEAIVITGIKTEPIGDIEIEFESCDNSGLDDVDHDSDDRDSDGALIVSSADSPFAAVNLSINKELKVYMTNEAGDPPFVCPCGKFRSTIKEHFSLHESIHKWYPHLFTSDNESLDDNA